MSKDDKKMCNGPALVDKYIDKQGVARVKGNSNLRGSQ
jgi:hypothetical protein